MKNLSLVNANEVVNQIEEKGWFSVNYYTDQCELAVVYDKNTGKFRCWDLVSQLSSNNGKSLDEYGYDEFVKEFPLFVRELNETSLEVLFCDNPRKDKLICEDKHGKVTNQDWLTPDGIKYSIEYTRLNEKGQTQMQVSFSSERFSTEEIKNARDLRASRSTMRSGQRW